MSAALAMACSGATADNLGQGLKGHSSSSSGGGSGSSTGSSGGSTSSGSSSGGFSSSSSGGSSGGQVDSGTIDTGVIDSGTTIDTGTGDEPPPTTGPMVLCPQMGTPQTCNAGEICCVAGNAMQGTQTDTCQGGGASCAGTPVRCGSAADCGAGQVCCGTQQTVSGVVSYTEVTCTAAAACANTNQRVFCDPAANDCPAQAPTCGQSQLMPGYNVCQ
jgi:hypothetical protein